MEVAESGGHGSGRGARGGGRGGQQEEKKELNVANWQTVFNSLQASNPDYEYIRVQDGSAAVHLKSSVTSRATDQYKFDKKTGEIQLQPYLRIRKALPKYGLGCILSM